MDKLVKLLSEMPMGMLKGKLNVVMRLDKTKHAGERQSRHGDGYVIDDGHIRDTVDSVLPKIANALMFDKIDVGDSVLIQNTMSDVNIVGKIESRGSMLEFAVITVMRKKGFKPKSGTYVIKI